MARMRILYAVFLVCLAALLWAVWAMVRTIRRHEQGSRKPIARSQTEVPRDEDAAS